MEQGSINFLCAWSLDNPPKLCIRKAEATGSILIVPPPPFRAYVNMGTYTSKECPLTVAQDCDSPRAFPFNMLFFNPMLCAKFVHHPGSWI
eukprot:1143818-Pelagomonas_calceolata.AAC.4